MIPQPQPPQYDPNAMNYPQNYQEYVSVPYKADDSVIKMHLDPSDLFADVEHKLKGEVKIREADKKGNVKEYWKKVRKPYMNGDGVGAMLTLLGFYLHKSTTLSYYNEEQIKNKMLSFCAMIKIWLIRNRKHWQMDNIDIPAIKNMMENTVESNLNRALFGGERKALSKETQIRQEMSSSSQEQKGFMDRLKGIWR